MMLDFAYQTNKDWQPYRVELSFPWVENVSQMSIFALLCLICDYGLIHIELTYYLKTKV